MNLNQPLAIAGLGAVSPAGIGVEALGQTRELAPEMLAGFGSDVARPVFRVDCKQAPLARWQREARARRASPITIFMLEAAHQALNRAGGVDPSTLGIVTAYGSGAIVPSRRFFEGVLKNGQRFASPNLFPETVFNSPTSHLASVLGVSGPCYSVVGDGSAWVNAIGVAACWLLTGLVEHALVVGAEELDPIILDAYVAARWIRPGAGFVTGEGAGAVLLRLARATDQVRVIEVAEGFTYRNKREACQAAGECVVAALYERRDSSGRLSQTAATVMKTAQHNWFTPIESELHRVNQFQSPPPLPYSGEAFTATAAWHTLWAVSCLQRGSNRLVVPIWGLNEQCSALLLEAQ